MGYLVVKAVISGLLIAAIAEVSRRYPGFGGLIASLPLVSVIGMIWIWNDTQDPARLADHSAATLWFVVPSLPMFALIAWMLRRGHGFWLSLATGCLLTVLLYLGMVALAPRLGIKL